RDRDTHDVSRVSVSVCGCTGILAPGSPLSSGLPAPRGRGRLPTSKVAEGRSPVTVAGQPRIHTGFPVAPGNLASGARDRTGVPGSVGTVPAMQAADAAGTPRRVLILGGSTEASRLARELAPREGYDVTVSYAGRTRQRTSTPGRIRVGGFGG